MVGVYLGQCSAAILALAVIFGPLALGWRHTHKHEAHHKDDPRLAIMGWTVSEPSE
jgi:hypothetical protein